MNPDLAPISGDTATTFDEHQAAWREWTASPWGRIRFAVVHHTLRRELAALGPGPHRVLDVGGGDGGDALALAEEGHDVTVLDPSTSMLATAAAEAAARGLTMRTLAGGIDDLPGRERYDVVLCHFVLHYRAGDPTDLARLAAAVRPGGLLSVVAPNPAGQVLAALVRRGPGAAADELGRETVTTATFDTEVRKVSAEEVRDVLEQTGLRVVGRYGGRIANDLLTDDEAKRDPAYFEELLALELSLCDQEPYRRIGAFWQLVASKS